MDSLNLSSTPAASPSTQSIVVWSEDNDPKPLERGEVVFLDESNPFPKTRGRAGQLQPTAKIFRRVGPKNVKNTVTENIKKLPFSTVAEAVTWFPCNISTNTKVYMASVALVIEGTDTLRLTPDESSATYPSGTLVALNRDTNAITIGVPKFTDTVQPLGLLSTAATVADQVVQVYFARQRRHFVTP
jgi:hypothetical protein